MNVYGNAPSFSDKIKRWYNDKVKEPFLQWATTPVYNLINNNYPFGYTDGKTLMASRKSLDFFKNVDPNSIAKPLADIAYEYIPDILASAVRMQKASKDAPIVKATHAFADLDLNKKENLHVADSLAKVITENEPVWGIKNWDRKSLIRNQKVIRGRIDQNHLHTRRKQPYNSYMVHESYRMPNGDPIYVARDPEIRESEKIAAREWLKNNKNNYTMSRDGKFRIYPVNRDSPYLQHGSNYSIITDADGSNPRYRDVWDFGVNGFSSNYWPGTKEINVGDYLY